MSKEYQVTCDLFSIPLKNNECLLYAPKVGFICEANKELYNLLANLDEIDQNALNKKQATVLEQLEENGVVNGSREIHIKQYKPGAFLPVNVTLVPTNQYKLRFIYCYASAGDFEVRSMKWETAKTAIDTIIRNAKTTGTSSINVGFHGGGEPLFRWNFIQKVTTYAEEQCKRNDLKLKTYSATNGVLTQKQLDWIVRHFSDLNISFDGLPEVQDYHRPLPNGEGSFQYIDRTIKFLDSIGFNYGIRSTISDYNIDLMEESYNFIVQNYQPKTIQFEPVFQCGRCKTKSEFNVSLEKFARLFQDIEQKNNERNIRFIYSGCRVETLTNAFCGVTRDSFTITPEGFITACFEIASPEDPKSEIFFYGKINEHEEVVIDDRKRKFLHELTVDNLEFCNDCFAKWHCAGDCVAKIGHSDLLGDRGHDRCELNRQMVKDKLLKILHSHKQQTKEVNLK